MASTKTTDPLLVIRLTEGLAARNRLPLSYVIKTLREIESMINDVGFRLLKERGVDDPKPDFGIELVAEGGIAFKKGSVKATIAITRYLDVGLLAAGEVIKTVETLSMQRRGPAVANTIPEPLSARVVQGLDRIAFINQIARTKTQLEVKAPKKMITAANMNGPMSRRATFGDIAEENLRTLRSPSFEENNVRLYGKLFRLKDSPSDDEQEAMFWGELHRDNGERWRIRFKIHDLPTVTPLFTQQVLVTGKAVYYPNASPKLEADYIERDPERDLEAAYAELYGSDRDIAPEAREP
ncbi:MAG TPA: hypothetical protein VMF91_18895 [Bryobacteraceae bacterium]|nr:hypothetical protein [Bryobacteraceae bacterium]